MRHAFINVTYDNVDISEDVSLYLTSFSYCDEAHGRQDNLSISLADPDARWSNEWYPQKGAKLEVSIELYDWESDGGSSSIALGVFQIDELTVSGKPRTAAIKAVAVPVRASLRNTRKSRAWQNVTLQTILTQLASENGMEPFYDSSGQEVKERLDQRGETDAQFLARIAEENGLCLKATNTRLVLYDAMEYETRDAEFSLDLNGDNITGYSITDKSDDIYTSCTVTYWDANAQEELSYTYEPQ